MLTVDLYFSRRAGLKAEAGPYFTWLAINGVAVLISISQGYMIGSLTPDIQIANIIAPLCVDASYRLVARRMC
jgi:hypothetical protein